MVPSTLTALNIFVFLLPGFLSDRISVSLNAPRQRSELLVVTDALVFTFVDYVLYNLAAAYLELPAIPVSLKWVGPQPRLAEPGGLGLLLLIAVVVGLVWAKLSGTGWLYNVLGWLRITRVTGRGDVWQDVFTDFTGHWFQVRLRDGTRITGWPKYSSDDPARRELFLAEAVIESPSGHGYDLKGPGVLLTERAEIERIEILS